MRALTITAPKATADEAHPPTDKAEAELALAEELGEADALVEMTRVVRAESVVVDVADVLFPVLEPVERGRELAVDLVVDLMVDEVFVGVADAPDLVGPPAAVLEPVTLDEVGLEEMEKDGLVA